jgi:hypothetical protein
MTTAARIDLRLRTVGQIFNTLDPSPFREQDLDAEAEEYIAESAAELPRDVPLVIAVHLPRAECATALAADLPTVVRRYFSGRELREASLRRQLFRDGRIALFIGLCILAACLFLSWQMAEGLLSGSFGKVLQEGLVIVGWVAIWRPAEIFLYDWLPIERRRRLMGRLARAEVIVQEDSGRPASGSAGTEDRTLA